MSHVSIRMLVGWEDENLEGARHHSQTISLLLLLSSLIFLYGTMRTYPFTTYLGMLGRKKGQGLLASFSFTFFFFFFRSPTRWDMDWTIRTSLFLSQDTITHNMLAIYGPFLDLTLHHVCEG